MYRFFFVFFEYLHYFPLFFDAVSIFVSLKKKKKRFFFLTFLSSFFPRIFPIFLLASFYTSDYIPGWYKFILEPAPFALNHKK